MKKSLHITKDRHETGSAPAIQFSGLDKIAERVFFYALKMIDIANHERNAERGEPKVGGHATACGSSLHILSAIHLVMRNPEDYFACKPHVSPIDHSLNYLLHNFRTKDGEAMTADQRKAVMRNLRHYSRDGEPVFQSYHAESDPDAYRFFPSGSVGIPPVNALYTALGYDFAKDHGFNLEEDPTFWCLMGDSEFREGSLMEAMPDAGERELGSVVWIVDYNRQNLDGTRISNEKALGGSDADRILRIAEANGWQPIKLKHGKKREAWFAKPGGDELRRVLDEEFTDYEFQALLSANTPKLTRDVLGKKSAKLKTWLKDFKDEEIHEVFRNLAGHDFQSLIEALQEAKRDRKKPTLIVAYTIKGWSLRCQALSGNHSALPESDELEEMSKRLGIPLDDPFQEFSPNSEEEKFLAERRKTLVGGIDANIERINERRNTWLEKARNISWPTEFEIGALKLSPLAHTQWMWGQIAAKLDRLAHGAGTGEAALDSSKLSENDRAWAAGAPYFVTMAPDVGSSTNTSPNMNGKLYGDIEQEDYESMFGAKDKKAPDVMPNLSKRSGHLRFEIAEGNCMSAAGSFGKFFHFTGLPFFPAMPIYDFFIKRAHDQFYYNLYWHSHFATLGTPSGVTLAPEGAQHSWKSDFQIPHCVTWEPCFAKELEWIFADMLRRHFTLDDEEREAALVRCVTKGIVQKDFLERLKAQPRFSGQGEAEIYPQIRADVLKGAYTLIDYRQDPDYKPGDNVVHLFGMGALAIEAMKASDLLREKGILANVHVVTSPDLLLSNFAYHENYAHLKEGLGVTGDLHLSAKKGAKLENAADWFSLQGARIPVISVHDGEPGLLDNIGSIVGVKHKSLAIRKTSKSGTTKDIFYFHHIDAESVAAAAEEILTETAAETFEVSREVLDLIRG